jgi:hypothetical protein
MINTAIDCHAVIAATNPSVTGDRERIAASGGLPVDAGDRNHRQTSTSSPIAASPAVTCGNGDGNDFLEPLFLEAKSQCRSGSLAGVAISPVRSGAPPPYAYRWREVSLVPDPRPANRSNQLSRFLQFDFPVAALRSSHGAAYLEAVRKWFSIGTARPASST